MTVKELISKLQKYPEDKEVVMWGTKGYCDHLEGNELGGLFPVAKVGEVNQPLADKNIGNVQISID